MTFMELAIAIAAVLVLWLGFRGYNRLVNMRNRVRSAWSDVDVQLAFRHNLVPNLVDTVKGYATHERQVLETVSQARSAAMSAGAGMAARAAAEMALSGAVGNLCAVAERYPQLKASQNFSLLQEQLTTTENRIAFARQHYNDAARRFNTAIAEFPWNMMAGKLGCVPAQMFSADAQDRQPVQIGQEK